MINKKFKFLLLDLLIKRNMFFEDLRLVISISKNHLHISISVLLPSFLMSTKILKVKLLSTSKIPILLTFAHLNCKFLIGTIKQVDEEKKLLIHIKLILRSQSLQLHRHIIYLVFFMTKKYL